MNIISLSTLSAALITCLLTFNSGCSYPRYPNYYRATLDGALFSAEGNDGELVRTIKVSVAEVRQRGEKRVFAILFENVSYDDKDFQYSVSWYNQLGIQVVKQDSWTNYRLAARSQELVEIEEPALENLHHFEIAVRPVPD